MPINPKLKNKNKLKNSNKNSIGRTLLLGVAFAVVFLLVQFDNTLGGYITTATSTGLALVQVQAQNNVTLTHKPGIINGSALEENSDSATATHKETEPQETALKQPILATTPTTAPTTTTSARTPPDEVFTPVAVDSTSTTASIRSWGCARNETPFIFVHIGKAGGGNVRARMAASARDYQRDLWHAHQKDPTYYYPIHDEEHDKRRYGRFVNSDAKNFLPHFRNETLSFTRTFKFEGVMPCHATTPLGHAMACPFEANLCQSATSLKQQQQQNTPTQHERCDVVYVGHNMLGSEMHWLPTSYLERWWGTTPWGLTEAERITDVVNNMKNNTTVAYGLAHRYSRSHRVSDATKQAPNQRFCTDGPLEYDDYHQLYDKCIYPEAVVADSLANQAITSNMTVDENKLQPRQQQQDDHHNDWSPVYASLPVMRVTMIREPFSWLKSRFFWINDHVGIHGEGMILPDKGEKANNKDEWPAPIQERYKDVPFVKCDHLEHLTTGWGSQAALIYIMYLCGEHCLGQYQAITNRYTDNDDANRLRQEQLSYLKVMELQAAYNLRNSFAVVGLLHETQDFFDMISQRVYYMDTSLNPHVKGQSHASGGGTEGDRCRDIYSDTNFRQTVMDQSPEIAVLERLYQVGVEVYEFQKDELAQCSSGSTGPSSA